MIELEDKFSYQVNKSGNMQWVTVLKTLAWQFTYLLCLSISHPGGGVFPLYAMSCGVKNLDERQFGAIPVCLMFLSLVGG